MGWLNDAPVGVGLCAAIKRRRQLRAHTIGEERRTAAPPAHPTSTHQRRAGSASPRREDAEAAAAAAGTCCRSGRSIDSSHRQKAVLRTHTPRSPGRTSALKTESLNI
ncbi:unnamed protein product [Pleuronectes platessa]|uniref:Uncharacterized protein n=1 Tax=Pleuronectes platessa TaxID=8262 RepID=A0A9N7YFW4_PLEPL|nr:unnamed protein product [Pleuronectes platessa]